MPVTAAAEAATTEERIRQAALVCVGRWGVAKTTLEDVARQAGLSRATVYRAFPGGKDALMAALSEGQIRDVMTAVAEAVSRASSLDDALTLGITAAGRWLAADPVFQYLLRNEPEAILPSLCFDGLNELLALITAFAAPLLEPWLAGPRRSAEGAEWAARIFLSHLVCPADDVVLSDETSVRRLVQSFVLPGLDPERVSRVH